MIELKNIVRVYKETGVSALKGVSFRFPKTGLFYIVGKSGSGKSTLLMILSGLDYDYEGSYLVDGVEVTKKERELREFRERYISISFQNDELEEERTVSENVSLSLDLIKEEKILRKKRIEDALRQYGLGGLASRRVASLSGGEKKRVGIARAALKDAAIYLFDEPLNGLSKDGRKVVSRSLVELSKTHLIIVVTHQEDEIISPSGIIKIEDGLVKENQSFSLISRLTAPKELKRRRPGFFHHFKNVFSKLIYNRVRTMISLSAIALGLSCFSIALLISQGVKDSIVQALLANIGTDCLVIEKKEYKILQDGRSNVERNVLEKARLLNRRITNIGDNYSGVISSLFPNKNDVSLSIDTLTTSFREIGFRNFLDTRNTKEIDYSFDNEPLDLDELYLGLPKDTIDYLLKTYRENDLADLNTICLNDGCFLSLKIANDSWGYDAELLFKVKTFLITSAPILIHSDEEFVTNIVEGELKLLGSDEYEVGDTYPWTLKRHSYISIPASDKESFIRWFYQHSAFKNYELEALTPLAVEEKNLRFNIVHRTTERLSLSEIDRILEPINLTDSYSYTTDFYLYGENGMFSGFTRPFYLGADKSKINELIDNNYQSEADLGDLQAFSIKTIEGVIGGDAYTNTKGQGFAFRSDAGVNVDQGITPLRSNQVLVSTGLIEALGLKAAPGFTLHYCYLKEVIPSGDYYRNIFVEGSFVAVGFVEEEKPFIYQNRDFLLNLGVADIKVESASNISKAIVSTGLESEDLIKLRKTLQQEHTDYYFSLPGILIKEAIDPTIDLIAMILFIFAAFSSLIAVFLLSSTILLFIIEDQKFIGLKLAFGYRKCDIFFTYTILSFIITFLSSSTAIITFVFAKNVFSKTLADMMGPISFSSSINAILALLGLSFLVAVFSSLSSLIPISKLSAYKAITKNRNGC